MSLGFSVPFKKPSLDCAGDWSHWRRRPGTWTGAAGQKEDAASTFVYEVLLNCHESLPESLRLAVTVKWSRPGPPSARICHDDVSGKRLCSQSSESFL